MIILTIQELMVYLIKPWKVLIDNFFKLLNDLQRSDKNGHVEQLRTSNSDIMVF